MSQDLKATIRAHIESHYPALYLITHEESDADTLVRELAEDRKIFEWNLASGLVNFENKQPLSKWCDLSDALANLLDQEFPFGALENLYVAILGRPIDRRNFRKKVLGFGILESTNRYLQQEKGRPGKLYQFNARKYQQLEKKGLIFDI